MAPPEEAPEASPASEAVSTSREGSVPSCSAKLLTFPTPPAGTWLVLPVGPGRQAGGLGYIWSGLRANPRAILGRAVGHLRPGVDPALERMHPPQSYSLG